LGIPAELVFEPEVEAPELEVPEFEVELWAQSAAGKRTMGTVNKIMRKMSARKRCDWLVVQSAEAMELEFSPDKTKIISLLESFLWISDANC
jgi:hypothetical protein